MNVIHTKAQTIKIEGIKIYIWKNYETKNIAPKEITIRFISWTIIFLKVSISFGLKKCLKNNKNTCELRILYSDIMSIKVGYKIKYNAFYSSVFPSGFTFLVQHFILCISEKNIYFSGN